VPSEPGEESGRKVPQFGYVIFSLAGCSQNRQSASLAGNRNTTSIRKGSLCCYFVIHGRRVPSFEMDLPRRWEPQTDWFDMGVKIEFVGGTHGGS
jgi:hypothetical protein